MLAERIRKAPAHEVPTLLAALDSCPPEHTMTPGPWLAILDRCSGKHGVISEACGGYCVAIVPENEANARAIGALPDLLEALRDCLGYLEADGNGDSTVAQAARTALTKATGKAKP
jgi:hypothetical protein